MPLVVLAIVVDSKDRVTSSFVHTKHLEVHEAGEVQEAEAARLRDHLERTDKTCPLAVRRLRSGVVYHVEIPLCNVTTGLNLM